MKYINAAEVLPDYLLTEIQRHISGEVIYIPTGDGHLKWGEKNGSKRFFEDRNNQIRQQYQKGTTIHQLTQDFGLAYETVRKIIYKA